MLPPKLEVMKVKFQLQIIYLGAPTYDQNIEYSFEEGEEIGWSRFTQNFFKFLYSAEANKYPVFEISPFELPTTDIIVVDPSSFLLMRENDKIVLKLRNLLAYEFENTDATYLIKIYRRSKFYFLNSFVTSDYYSYRKTAS